MLIAGRVEIYRLALDRILGDFEGESNCRAGSVSDRSSGR